MPDGAQYTKESELSSEICKMRGVWARVAASWACLPFGLGLVVAALRPGLA